MARKISGIYLFFSIFLLICNSAFAQEYIQVNAAIDVSTNVSDGKYGFSDMAEIARLCDVNVIISGDGFFNKWQYGLWPLRNIIRKTEATKSVMQFGVDRYMKSIEDTNRNNPDILFMGGFEVGPAYFWEGSPFENVFSIKDWHKHILVLGMNNAKDIKNIPSIGNGFSLVNGMGFSSSSALLMPVILLALGVMFRRIRILAVIFIILGALFFINGWPFAEFKYDQYHGDRGSLPYQNLIDYANNKAALTFWLHPETRNIEKIGNVNVVTEPYQDLLLSTKNYTGFAIFYEGYDKVGRPEGIWDMILMDYCKGIRPRPIWAIGTLDFEKAGKLDDYFNSLRTVLLVENFTKDDILDAMKKGRMYVSKGTSAPNFMLDKFSVKDDTSHYEKIIGETFEDIGKPHLIIRGRYFKDEGKPITLNIIKNGQIIKTLIAKSPFNIDFEDNDYLPQGKSYYRIELIADGLVLVANPIFVTRR